MRILVVEDEARIRAFLLRGLEAEGFAVDGAEDGMAGIERALDEHCNLVVLDLLLPRRDGFSVLRELHGRRPDLPVMVLSARGDLNSRLRSFELGASDFVAKPFSLDELIARIRVQLRRRHAGDDDATLRRGALALDVTRRRVTIGLLTADLSDREFRVLHRLVVDAGEVVSRERLLADVWGYHFDPGSNVVDVCVRRLRKKLGSQAPIETVRNAGYRLVG